jgi:hypothetical protein
MTIQCKVNSILGACILAAGFTVLGCNPQQQADEGSPPASPIQTPGPALTDLSEANQNFQDELTALNSVQGEIESAYKEWARQGEAPAAPDEPVYPAHAGGRGPA